jgi:hypothetical protein
VPLLKEFERALGVAKPDADGTGVKTGIQTTAEYHQAETVSSSKTDQKTGR